MSRLKWRSTNSKERKRAPGAGVLHWESRDPLAVTHVLWTRLSQPEDLRWEATSECKRVIIYIICYDIAEGLHGHVAEKVVLSFDAQSESAVQYQQVFPWDAPLSHRQEIVYLNACRAPGSEDEPGGTFLADVDSIENGFCFCHGTNGHFTNLRDMVSRMRCLAPPSSQFSTVTAPAEPAEPAEPEDPDPELRCKAIVDSLQHRDLTHESAGS